MRKWLQNIRGERTQQEIARECGISQNFYCWIETGERTPSVETAKAIAEVLGFNWTRFFEEDTSGRETGSVIEAN